MADEKHQDRPEREGDVLGLGDTRVPPQTENDRELAEESKIDPDAGARRRRADDLAGAEESTPSEDADDSRGLHVKG